jgi:CheY-like chemotaxis protein
MHNFPFQSFSVGSLETRNSPAGKEPAAAAHEGAAQPPHAGKRILVMDDEASILELTARMLSSQGYDVETATNGNRAVAQYRAAMEAGTPFDALILDLTVPEGMGGFDAFKTIQGFDPGVKGILSSGYSHEPVVLNYKKYGLAGVVPKPYKVRELLDTVAGVAGR